MNPVKRVPVEDLHMYCGRVMEDIVSDKGTLLLPRGSDMPSILSAIPDIKWTLQQWNVGPVPIQVDFNISEKEFDVILRTIEPEIQRLDPVLAWRAIRQVKDVYRRLSENKDPSEGIMELAGEAKTWPFSRGTLPRRFAPATRNLWTL